MWQGTKLAAAGGYDVPEDGDEADRACAENRRFGIRPVLHMMSPPLRRRYISAGDDRSAGPVSRMSGDQGLSLTESEEMPWIVRCKER
jgi:hypothetical protein